MINIYEYDTYTISDYIYIDFLIRQYLIIKDHYHTQRVYPKTYINPNVNKDNLYIKQRQKERVKIKASTQQERDI